MAKILATCVFCLLTLTLGIRCEPYDAEVDDVKSKIEDAEDPLQVVYWLASKCIAELNATTAELMEFKEKRTTLSRRAKCLRACVAEKLGLVDDSGTLERERAVELASEFLYDRNASEVQELLLDLRKVVDFCYGSLVPSLDKCESIGKIMDCLQELATMRGILSV